MRSFLVTALCLTLIPASYARVAHSFQVVRDAEAEPEPQPEKLAAIKNWFAHMFRRDITPRQDIVPRPDNGTCYEDVYYGFVSELGPEFCQAYMNYPNITVTTDYTPLSTVTITSTKLDTLVDLDRVTPTSTITTTVAPGGSQRKRDVEPETTPAPLAPHEIIDRTFQRFRRQNAAAILSSGSAASSSIAAGFSSACSCQDYTGPTVTVSYTNAAEVDTLRAFVRGITTIYTTKTAAAVYTTLTVTAQPETSTPQSSPSSSGPAPSASGSASQSASQSATSAASSGPGSASQSAASESSQSSSPAASGSVTTGSGSGTQASTSTTSSNPGPTAPAFTCPDDNNSTVSQMIGNERFDYLVLCDTILGDTDFYVFNYNSFAECAASCSLVDARFDYPLCQGISYYSTAGSSNSGNCHLKKTANQTFPLNGVDTAVLQRIAIGLSSNDNDSVSTEVPSLMAGPTPTQNSEQLSSSISSMMSNLSTVISVSKPPSMMQSGLLGGAQPPITAYSTYVSEGTTYSSGTTYSFATTYANGSWVSQYYVSWTAAWASATTVYGASETGYSVQNSTNSDSSVHSGADGSSITITTTNTTTFYPEGYNVTEVIEYVTKALNGSVIGSTAETSIFSYQTAAAGGGSGGGASGGPASTNAGPLTSTSVFSTQTVIVNSGATGGASGISTGGSPPSSFESVIVNSGATGGSTGFSTGGGPPSTTQSGVVSSSGTVIVVSSGTGGASSGAGSGGPSSTQNVEVSSTGSAFSTVIIVSGATGGVSSAGASGGPGQTGGSMGTGASGVITSTSVSQSTGPGSSPSSGLSVVTVISGTPSNTGGETSTAASGAASSPSSTSGAFSNTNVPRSGEGSSGSSTPTGSAETASSGTTQSGTAPASGSIPPLSTATASTESAPSTNTTAAPSETASTSGNSSLTIISTGTYPSPSSATTTGTFTNTNIPRSGDGSSMSSSSSGASGTAPSSGSLPILSTGGGYSGPPPSGTSVNPMDTLLLPSSSPVSSTSQPRSGEYSTTTSEIASPISSGPTESLWTTLPPVGYITLSNGLRVPYWSTPYPSSSTLAPSGSASTSMGSDSSQLPPPLSTSSCVSGNGTMGTITVFSTVTEYGCASTCQPWGGGGVYAGPQSFGPPAWGTASPLSEASSAMSVSMTVKTTASV